MKEQLIQFHSVFILTKIYKEKPLQKDFFFFIFTVTCIDYDPLFPERGTDALSMTPTLTRFLLHRNHPDSVSVC